MQSKKFTNRWLIDGIGEEYKEWKNKFSDVTNIGSAKIFIESPTGTGKTTFILKKLLPFAMENNDTVLYLSNRNALREQIEKEASSQLTHTNKYEAATETIRYYGTETFTNLIILNYHSFFRYFNEILEPQYPLKTTQIKYVVLDEAHFFLEDALFNTKTCEILDELLSNFSNTTMIFMSATITDLYNIWRNVVKKINVIYQSIGKQYIQAENTFYYINDYKKPRYKLFYYFEDEELIYKIKNTSNNEKWLIFTMSKKHGDYLVNKMPKNIKTTFLSSKKKGNKTWKSIIEKEEFNEDVLISTKVLDNGINIKSEQDCNGKTVKHIALPSCYAVEFMQMLGRRRIKDNETVNVYIQLPNIQNINRKIWQFEDFENNISKYKRAICNKKGMTNLIRECWRDGRNDIKNLFYIDAKRDLVANPLAEHKIDIMLKFYNNIKSNFNKPDFYIDLVKDWMQGNIIGEPKHIYFWDCDNLIDILEKYENIMINKEAQNSFYIGLLYNLKLYGYNKYGAESNIYISFLNIRKSEEQRKATLNRAFRILQLPYEIIKKNNCWVIVRCVTE